MGLTRLILRQGWEFKQSLLNGAIIVNVDGVLEHVIDKIGIWFYEVVQYLEHLQIFLFSLKECAESHIVCVEVHCGNGRGKLLSVCDDGFISFFYLFLFLLQAFEFFVNLLLHHSIEVLLLDLKLLDDASKGFLQALHLFIELLPYLLLKLTI